MSYQYRPSGFGGMPMVVKNLLIINVLVYFLSLFFLKQMPRVWELLVAHYFQADDFRPHQLVTAMFMHSPVSFHHIIGNMLGLWVFGSMLENVWGPKRFLIFYMVCGVGANVCDQIYLYFKLQHAFDNEMIIAIEEVLNYRSLGASGAIYGLLMGAALLFPNTELYLYFMIPIKIKYVAIIFGLIAISSVISAVPGDNVAHLVHLSGMLFGFILIKIWSRDRRQFY